MKDFEGLPAEDAGHSWTQPFRTCIGGASGNQDQPHLPVYATDSLQTMRSRLTWKSTSMGTSSRSHCLTTGRGTQTQLPRPRRGAIFAPPWAPCSGAVVAVGRRQLGFAEREWLYGPSRCFPNGTYPRGTVFIGRRRSPRLADCRRLDSSSPSRAKWALLCVSVLFGSCSDELRFADGLCGH